MLRADGLTRKKYSCNEHQTNKKLSYHKQTVRQQCTHSYNSKCSGTGSIYDTIVGSFGGHCQKHKRINFSVGEFFTGPHFQFQFQ